ncbi:efflux transporter outer membrane subunit [Sediminitomix flava]|uniref:NodT family efflux transporter outer membrane factor (OMF) lipoprotein n=1 Tax=Sediminitomix flava TaxID=379075 RepID=A0A315ZJ23_SEDFL|nr:efflux transporter outer membrane subunit [Sediminitomix flava]PWJ45090.1 NodT family efflux transporter outer membrane factor (OMF) lipoprotein [Sediminitomix flava]
MMKSMYKYYLLLGLSAFGCRSIEQAQSSSEVLENAKSMENVEIPNSWTDLRDSENEDLAVFFDWMKDIENPQLKYLIREAWEYNADLNAVDTRIQQAEKYMTIAKSKMLPVVGASASGTLAVSNPYNAATNDRVGWGLTTPYTLAVGASWEADIWGKNRYGIESAEATRFSAEYSKEMFKQIVATQIISNWLSAVAVEQQLGVIDGLLAKQLELRELFNVQYNVGVLDEKHIIQISSEIADLQEKRESVLLANVQAKRAIETLVGRYPSGKLEISTSLPEVNSKLPTEFPLQLIEKRPDVLVAQYQVEKAFYNTKQADAARLPSLSIPLATGIGTDPTLNGVKNTPFLGLAPQLVGVIFAGGALKANVDMKDAQHKEAIAMYAKSVLNSFKDVEDALAIIETNENKIAKRLSIIEMMKEKYALSKIQYEVGNENEVTLKLQELQLLIEESKMVQLKTEKALARVQLFNALGGVYHLEKTKENKEG